MELTLCNCSQKKLILATSLFQILVTRSIRQYISIVLTNEFLNLPCGSANKLVYTPLVIANYNSSQRHKKNIYKCLRWYWEHKPVIQAIAVMKLDNFYELKASQINIENHRQEGLIVCQNKHTKGTQPMLTLKLIALFFNLFKCK